MAATNPNGANATMPDPRQQVCWDFYVETINKGFPNAQESALKAGYEPSTAKTITVIGWFKERMEGLRRKEMFSKAEKVLDKTLDYIAVDEEGKINVPLLQVQTKVASTLVTTLGKDKGYSTKTETDITTGGEKLDMGSNTPALEALRQEFEAKLKKELIGK